MRTDRDRPQYTPRRSHLWPWCAASVLLLCAGLLSGCKGVVVNSVTAHVTGYPLTGSPAAEDTRRVQAQANTKALKWYEQNEWRFNQPNNSPPRAPQTCIALSGGGIRSAAFSIGVLKGLEEKGVLAATDVISSVSGGGYALAWYYIKHLEVYENTRPEHKQPKPDVFSPESLEALASRARFITKTHMAGGILANILFIPVNVVLNGLWGMHNNTTPARRMYQEEIVKTFMDERATVRLQDLTADKDCREVDGTTGTCSLLTYFKLPLPIVNTTARIDDDRNRHNSYLARTVFEFTPLRFGNDGFDYVTTGEQPYPLSFAEAIAVSGASADASILPGSGLQIVGSALNQDLGYFIDNYNEPEGGKWYKILPFPFYLFMDSYRRDKQGTDIYLSDGGHAENLGAYSLVRRLCRQITIVDAEHDPGYTFESYFKLKAALRRDMHVDLSVPEIDRVDRSLEWENQTGSRAGRWREVPVKPGVTWATPVADGSIGRFPVESDEQTTDLTLKVKYVKLSIDRRLFEEGTTDASGKPTYKEAIDHYGLRVVSFFRTQCPEHTQKTQPCPFPQYSTVDQSYSEEQFMAYVELGYQIIMKHYR